MFIFCAYISVMIFAVAAGLLLLVNNEYGKKIIMVILFLFLMYYVSRENKQVEESHQKEFIL